MRPLLFLATRTIKNSARRALTSPTRLLGLLFFIAYYLWIGRSAFGGASGDVPALRLDFPPIEGVRSVVFTGFAVANLFLLLGIFSSKGGFRSADVETLFPTPINPKVVVAFRLARDYFLTLFVPLLLATVTWRPASETWTGLFREVPNPTSAGLVFKALMVAYLLMAIGWVATTNACNVWFNRPTRMHEQAFRVANWAAGILLFSVIAIVAVTVQRAQSSSDVWELTQNPVIMGVFFLATAATEVALAPLTADWSGLTVGLVVLVGFIALGLSFAMRQAPWYYELAALNSKYAEQTQRSMQAQDTFALAASRVQRGKRIRVGRSWVHGLRIQGPWALLWKEYLLQARINRLLLLLLSVVSIGLSMWPGLLLEGARTNQVGWMLPFMNGMTAFSITASFAQSGYIEALRRVDVQKALPFSPSAIVFFETAAKALLPAVVSVLGAIAAVAMEPRMIPFALATAIFVPSLCLLLSAVFLVMILLFPDVDDPTQRGFRGMITMLGIVVFCSPAAGVVVAGVTWLHWAPAIATIPAMGLNVLLALGAAAVGGQLYQAYNPSE